jgi:exopolyphosphatase/guanosine-5'-triphosphate,3'-diphosphate pyrophosphatase
MIKAVVDVGSNSVLLLVATDDSGQWVPILETSAVTALGEGTKSSRLLGEKGMSATLAALLEAFETARKLGATEIIAAVTMAGRIATNTPDFLARAAAQKSPVTVLSGEREAELGFLAVAEDPTFNQNLRVSVIDVGGHSTELVTADREGSTWHTRYRRSFSLGTLGLMETCLSSESPDGLQLIRASALIDDEIGMIYLPGQSGCTITLGATGTNLVSIREAMPKWEPEKVHGARLTYEEVSKAVAMLCSLTNEGRAKLPGIEPGREKTLHIGALILERFLNTLKIDECRVSVRGWRYGLLGHSL